MSSEEYAQDCHLTTAEYRAWLERQRPKLAAELTELLPDWARDAGMRFEWENIPARNGGILAYDAVLPKWPDDGPWMPFRDRIPRASGCYQLASGAMVHIKPGCRC